MKTILQFLLKVGKLKRLPRRGWVLRKIKNPESVADHSFRLTVMAMILSNGGRLDREKLIKMALVHDLVEVFAGDTTPYDDLINQGANQDEIVKRWPGYSKEEKERRKKEKHQRELESLRKLVKGLPEKHRREIEVLWDEYESAKTREAVFVRQLDKIENLMQAVEYARENLSLPVDPFWIENLHLVDNPALLSLLDEIEKFSQGE